MEWLVGVPGLRPNLIVYWESEDTRQVIILWLCLPSQSCDSNIDPPDVSDEDTNTLCFNQKGLWCEWLPRWSHLSWWSRKLSTLPVKTCRDYTSSWAMVRRRQGMHRTSWSPPGHGSSSVNTRP